MPYTIISAKEWMIQFLDALQDRAACDEVNSHGPSGALEPAQFVPKLAPGGVANLCATSPDDRAPWIVGITMSYARQKTPVLLMLEVGQCADLALQFVSAVGHIDRNRLRDATPEDDEWPRLIAAVEELRVLPLTLVERDAQSQGVEDVLGEQVAAQFDGSNLLVVLADGKSCEIEAKLRSRQRIFMRGAECHAAALAHAADTLLERGYQVVEPKEEAYGNPQLLIKLAGSWIPIPVLASADGIWMLGIKPAGAREAIDEWLARQATHLFVILVQFRGVSTSQVPRTYLARPEEIAAHVRANTTGCGNAFLREPLPAAWQVAGSLRGKKMFA